MLPYYKLCALIFALLFYSLSIFFDCCSRPCEWISQLNNGSQHTILNMLSSRPHNTVPTGIHYRNHRTIQSGIKSSRQIDSPGSKGPNGRAACPAGPAEDA